MALLIRDTFYVVAKPTERNNALVFSLFWPIAG
jgi:hypothetical protein